MATHRLEGSAAGLCKGIAIGVDFKGGSAREKSHMKSMT
jgi:hypothetical protein